MTKWHTLARKTESRGNHDVINAVLSQEIGKHASASKWAKTRRLIKVRNWLDH